MELQDKYIRFDWAVKRLLRHKANFGVLEGFLTVLIGDEIHIVEILESEGNQQTENDKFNRVDIKALNSKNEIVIIEIQNTRELYYLERILYGVAKAITEHISLGETYYKVKKIYSISILYFDIGHGTDYLYHGQNIFKGVHTGDFLQVSTREKDAIVPRMPSEIYPEYFLIRVNEFNKVAVTPLEEWIEYLKTGIIRPDTTAPGLGEAREKLKYYSMTPQERHAYDEHLSALMIQNDVLQEIDWDQITNKENIGEVYLKSCEGFDPGNKYCVPYTFGTVGILYNKELVDEDAVIDSWDVLWDETYKNDIIMQDSVRDAFMISLKRLGYSCNTTDEDELNEAMEELKIQSKLNKAYTIDEVRDKMINGAAAIGVIYSGEYLYCQEENEDLEYVIPKEGTNIWYDGWVITKGSENVENAHKWIDFLCSQEAAYDNFEYIYYGTPNIAAQELIDEDIINNPGVFPDEETIEKCEVYNYLGEEAEDMYYELWKKVK